MIFDKKKQSSLLVTLDELPEDDHLKALYIEYVGALDRINKFEDRLIQTLTLGLTVLTILVSLINKDKIIDIPFTVALVGPLILYVFCVIVLINIIYIYSTTAVCRMLSSRINKYLKEDSLILFNSKFTTSRLLSLGRGDYRMRFLIVILIFWTGLLSIPLFIFTFNKVYSSSEFWGLLYIIFYSITTIIFIFLFSSVVISLPKELRKLTEKVEKIGNMSVIANIPITKSLWKVVAEIIFFILPRPIDALLKGVWFLVGLVAAIVFVSPETLTVEKFKFLENAFHIQKVNIPIITWTVYFFLQEVLLQQAKLAWDDLRDRQIDKKLSHNLLRGYASGIITRNIMLFHVFVRLFLAFAIVLIIGNTAMVWFYIAILTHQIIYVLIAKPRARSHPLWLLITVSPNIALRFIGGVLAYAGIAGLVSGFIPYLAGILCLLSFGFMSVIWQIEEQHAKDEKKESFRLQGAYFLQKGNKWHYWGFLTALVIITALLFMQANQNLNFLFLGIWFVMIYGIIFKLKKYIPKIRFPLIIFLTLLIYYFFHIAVLGAKGNSEWNYLIGFTLIIWWHIIMFENLTYKEYSMSDLFKKVFIFLKASYYFVFTLDMPWKKFIKSIS